MTEFLKLVNDYGNGADNPNKVLVLQYPLKQLNGKQRARTTTSKLTFSAPISCTFQANSKSVPRLSQSVLVRSHYLTILHLSKHVLTHFALYIAVTVDHLCCLW